MTETTLLILVLLFLAGCFGVVYYYDRKIVKAIAEYEERLDLEPINYVLTDEDGNVRVTYGDEF